MTIEDVVAKYEKLDSVAATARELCISECTVIKCLVTCNAYTNETYEAIKKLRDSGMPPKEIAKKLCISESVVSKYTPYTNRRYIFAEKSANARRIDRCRAKKKGSA